MGPFMPTEWHEFWPVRGLLTDHSTFQVRVPWGVLVPAGVLVVAPRELVADLEGDGPGYEMHPGVSQSDALRGRPIGCTSGSWRFSNQQHRRHGNVRWRRSTPGDGSRRAAYFGRLRPERRWSMHSALPFLQKIDGPLRRRFTTRRIALSTPPLPSGIPRLAKSAYCMNSRRSAK